MKFLKQNKVDVLANIKSILANDKIHSYELFEDEEEKEGLFITIHLNVNFDSYVEYEIITNNYNDYSLKFNHEYQTDNEYQKEINSFKEFKEMIINIILPKED